MSEGTFAFGIGMVFVIGIGGSVGSCAYYYPQYQVYSQRLAGEAAYQEAESSRRIRVLEAQASLDSAALTAKAEVERSKGVAAANQIIANSLGGSEGYLRWRYIEMLEQTGMKGGHDIIYVPTEANLPILEAGRRP